MMGFMVRVQASSSDSLIWGKVLKVTDKLRCFLLFRLLRNLLSCTVNGIDLPRCSSSLSVGFVEFILYKIEIDAAPYHQELRDTLASESQPHPPSGNSSSSPSDFSNSQQIAFVHEV